ncbi:anthranilate phosphoribosyltransferase [Paenibacillus hexagrammi]|uniref:Anthranilate phosphoribosyltransferase n=1 Tax=Paenibacillus hexagrammi TaxID=2908839 RepID=A0ABY3SFH3_9BACL|nr:anthranilate phosphoribosyltransferase [Paenibacillus sp. YPD9-1]UJF31989.1 anthranilate phosphoribosyltransferase [Paenibacillus sp. YPD9-1]
MKEWIQAIGSGQSPLRNLTYEEAVQAAGVMASGESTDAQCAAFLIALCMKGEVHEELAAFVDVFRSHAKRYQAFKDSLVCAGPSEGRHSLPLTLPVSLLLASVGFPQVLQGGDALPPKQGISMTTMLESFGVELDLPTKAWETILFHTHIGFIRTEHLCPPMGRLKQVREQIGLRTIMNTVEQVLNPVSASNAIIGVHQKKGMEALVPISVRSGFQNSYLIQGIDGSEDLPISQNSVIRIVTPWGDESLLIEPQKFGFQSAPLIPLELEEQLVILQRIIAGDDSPELKRERDHIIFNAGLRLKWFDKVGSYEEGFQLADSLLRRREAQKVLTRWVEQTNRYKDFLHRKDESSSEQTG